MITYFTLCGAGCIGNKSERMQDLGKNPSNNALENLFVDVVAKPLSRLDRGGI